MADRPELFPAGIEQGFTLTGRLRASMKLGVRLRQLRLRHKQVFTLRPRFVFGSMTGTVAEWEQPRLLLSVETPCWVVTKVCGRNDPFWQRLLERLGRNRLVACLARWMPAAAGTDTQPPANAACAAWSCGTTSARSPRAATSPARRTARLTDATQSDTTHTGFTISKPPRPSQAVKRTHRKR